MAATNNLEDDADAVVVSPYGFFKGKEKKTDEELVKLLTKFNFDVLASKDFCNDKFKGGKLKCNCLSILAEGEDNIFCQAVAEYQLVFGRQKGEEQKRLVIEWMRSNLNVRHKRYRIPFITSSDDDPEDYIPLKEATACPSAIMELLGKGRRWWNTCKEHADRNTLPSHKSKGKISNNKRKFNTGYAQALKDHFELLKKEAEPVATGWVREKTGETTLRDANDEVLYLPPSMTKRGCYAKFCLERGVLIKTTNKGNPKQTPIDGVTSLPCPSWTAYRSFWDKHYKLLKVRRPVEDICSFCYKFTNRHKYKANSAASNEAGRDGDTDDDEQEAQDDTPRGETDDTRSRVDPNRQLDPVDVDNDTLETELSLMEAALHVKMARAQRTLVNNKIIAARTDRSNKVEHSRRTYTLICDFGQNMALPHFGAHQPGDTYYYTPLNLFNFGVADVSFVGDDGEEADHLYCHLFKEGDGGKGGNNVASLVMKTLRKLQILQHKQDGMPLRGKELNLVMDNCGGQNKNNHVLLLAPYLVELGYFKQVNIIFLIVGHTKNVCDRRFNNLKHAYHKSQVFNLSDATKVCNKSKYVTVWEVDTTNDWRDFHGMFMKFYLSNDKAKYSIINNHIFTCKLFNGNIYTPSGHLYMHSRRSDLNEHKEVRCDIIKQSFLAETTERFTAIFSMNPDRIEYAGLPGYKQVLLWKNYLQFVPAKYHTDPMYKKPSDELLQSEKQDKKERKLAKEEKKKKKAKVVFSSV